jgi:hypothetical protein
MEVQLKNTLILSLACLVLSSCVTAPIPSNHAGPTARIRDTAIAESSRRAQFYYVAEIDGQKIDNALFETRKTNSGRGFSQVVADAPFERDVAARPTTLKLRATIAYGAPILEIANASTVYAVEKTINFLVQPYKSYVVKGQLTADKQDVWLEDFITGQRVE